MSEKKGVNSLPFHCFTTLVKISEMKAVNGNDVMPECKAFLESIMGTKDPEEHQEKWCNVPKEILYAIGRHACLLAGVNELVYEVSIQDFVTGMYMSVIDKV